MINSHSHPHISQDSNCAIIVAHPDDETLWAGGTVLSHPQAKWTIITLCRKSDPDRQPKFFRALEKLNAAGAMGNLDDGPEQNPLDSREIQNTIMELLPLDRFDIILTHGLWGEYTRHLRHEEVGEAVVALWKSEKLFARQIWRFAYEDGGGKYPPCPIRNADIHVKLSEQTWQQKYVIITEVYGFAPDSFEAKAVSHEETFWYFGHS